MNRTDTLQRARAAFARRSWSEAISGYLAVDRESGLDPEDLERLAHAAYLIGNDRACEDALTRAHQAFLSAGGWEGAARCAFWLAFASLINGDMARGGGWIARAQRILSDGAHESVIHGYLLLPPAIRCVIQGDAEAAHGLFSQATEVGRRFHDIDLIAMALHGCGRALIGQGRNAEGVALLDEAMISVTSGELSPIVAGDIYCSVIEACHEIFDLRRAREWTAALDRWCASHADVVRFQGQCLIRRAELLQLRGSWPDAIEEARRACERLSKPPQRAIGAAFYQTAELFRLRGEFARAEDMYRQAGQSGRNPQPGLSLLRLAQGEIDLAAAAIRTTLGETREGPARCRLLAAYVEIMIAARDVSAARAGSEELSTIAAALDAPFLRAASWNARGAVLLADGDGRAALGPLHQALAVWDELEIPYEAARTHALIGRAYRELGDDDSADIQLEAARQAFKRLGAIPDLARMAAAAGAKAATPTINLSTRELEVLRCLVTGKTNRAIADELCISEKTVARHVSNIFNKLGLSSRAAATAYAYKHHLV